jgi:hypothetical protein
VRPKWHAWPTSRTTQVFHDIAVDLVSEFAKDYEKLNWTRLPAAD